MFVPGSKKRLPRIVEVYVDDQGWAVEVNDVGDILLNGKHERVTLVKHSVKLDGLYERWRRDEFEPNYGWRLCSHGKVLKPVVYGAWR